MCYCFPPIISLDHTKLRSLARKTGTPSFSFFLLVWLGCHRCRTDRSCLRTLLVPGVWAHCDITTMFFLLGRTARPSTPSNHPPLQSLVTFVTSSWQDILIWAWLVSFVYPPQLVQGATGMTFVSCSKELPIWHPQFGPQEVFVLVSTKTPLSRWTTISQENSLHFGGGNFPMRTTSPITWGYSLMWTQSVPYWEPGAC
jgi:hypothetical protein